VARLAKYRTRVLFVVGSSLISVSILRGNEILENQACDSGIIKNQSINLNPNPNPNPDPNIKYAKKATLDKIAAKAT